MFRFLISAGLIWASAAQADEMVTYTTDQSFGDVTFGV